MAIKVQPADTQFGPTLMGRILPGPINNRIGYGYLKKNPKRVWVFVILSPNPNPDLTRLSIKLPKTLLPLIFHTQPSHSPSISLTASLSSPSLTHD